MTHGQSLFIAALFAAVLVFAFFMFRWALRQRARTTRRLDALGVPAADLWRRFARALGAMYLLAPPAMRSGSRDNDAVFFGLGAHRAAAPVEPALRQDWGVTDAASAARVAATGWAFAAERARRAAAVRGARPEDAAAVLAAWSAPSAPAQALADAWRRRDAGASMSDAYGAVVPQAADAAADAAPVAGVAFDIARHVHLARMAAQAGWMTPADEEAFGDRFALLALLCFDGWAAFAADFAEGMRAFRGKGLSGALYDKSVEGGLAWLGNSADSPWKRVQWPAAAGAG